MRHRSEIDGLRAVSIAAVVSFHVGFPWASGGFVGVDVFFVISGYLITSILYEEGKQRQLSLVAFYDRRIRRIFPALLTVLMATLVAGYWLLTPDDYVATAKSAAYGAGSLANVFFYKNTGYFDGAAGLQPLLHIWSLAVEEQFYLVWPTLLGALMRFGRGRREVLLSATVGIGAASLGLAVFQVGTVPKAAFYLTPGRAWELALGALIVFLPDLRLRRVVQEVVGFAGIVLICSSVSRLTVLSPFPGLNALPPTVGAALIIWSTSTGRTAIQYALSVEPLVFLGKISYSLYLWHWPLLVFWRHFHGGAPLPLLDGCLIAALAILISAASWLWIEQPFRRFRARRIAIITGGLASAAIVASVAAAVILDSGLPQRFDRDEAALLDRGAMWAFECPEKLSNELGSGLCVAGAPWRTAKMRGIVWGDSIAEQYMPFLNVVGKNIGISFVLYHNCPAFVSADGVQLAAFRNPNNPKFNQDCTESRNVAFEFLLNHTEVNLVILAAAWSTYPPDLHAAEVGAHSSSSGLELMSDGLDELMLHIVRPGRQIVLLGDVARFGYQPIPCVLALKPSLLRAPCAADPAVIPIREFRDRQAPTNELLRRIAQKWGASVLIPGDSMCGEAGCLTYLNGEFLYRDWVHLRRNLSNATILSLANLLELPKLFSDLQVHNASGPSHVLNDIGGLGGAR